MSTNIFGDLFYYDVNFRYKDEIFVDIKGYEGLYQISNYGRVLSLEREVKDKGIKTVKEKIRNPQNTRGWQHVELMNNGEKKIFRIHRLVLLHFVGEPPEGMQTNHKDGIKTHNHVSNLEWCTPKENIQHSYRLGMSKGTIGDYKPNSKLNSNKVREIYKMLLEGKTRKIIAKYMNVSEDVIGNVVRGEDWRHVGLDFSIFKRQYVSNYKGVSWDSKMNRWRAQKIINGKRIHLGYHKTEKEAMIAYNNFINNLKF